MIKGIYIENFKGIGEPGIKIDLEPVTLLFGNNSAGKSTVFHAILLAYEVLVRGNFNPDKTELGGAVVDLGGFPCFIHQHEQQRVVKLKFDLDLSSVSLDQEWRIDERVVQFDEASVDIGKAGEDVWSATVQIELSWDESKGSAFVSRYAIALDGTELGEILDGRLLGGSVLLHLNPSHPVLSWPEEDFGESIGVLDYLIPSFRSEAEDLFFTADPMSLDSVAKVLNLDNLLQEELPIGDSNSVADSDKDESYPETDVDDSVHDSESDLERSVEESKSLAETYVIELESLTALRQKGDVEIRRYVHDHDNGLMFEAYLYRLNGGSIGPLAAHFYCRDGWLPKNASKAVLDWQDLVGFYNEDREREAHTLTLKSDTALPNWHLPFEFQFMSTAIAGNDTDVDQEDLEFVGRLLSRLLIVPGRTLVKALDACRYVGPLREIPSRQFFTPSTPDRSRWATGLAAWDFLCQCTDETLTEISDWLADDKRLGTRHKLIRNKGRELPSDGLEIQRLQADDYLDDMERIRDLILSRPESVKIQLYDQTLRVSIDPHDCAIGIAQLVPVVVAGVTSQPNHEKPDQHGMFLIEQPELHNHPSVEVALGDLFIETVHQKHCRFILETHGEHLMLRVLRRIRETTDGELPNGVNGLLPEEVAVYFIERTEAGVTSKRLRIDETGEFIDKWPKGFFRERAEELF